MDDQVRISLLIARVSLVVVDAVPVEGQSRITKQKCRVGQDTAVPLGHSVVTLRCSCSHRTRRWRLAVNDVLLLGDAGRAIATYDVLDCQERQGAAFARLILDLQDPAASCR